MNTKNHSQSVIEYHERTKHLPNRPASSSGYLDWSNEPNLFRSYEGTNTLKFPFANTSQGANYSDLFERKNSKSQTFSLKKRGTITKMMQSIPKVLFVCTENSCRSQMAEGLLKHYGNGEFEVYSAGLRPSYVHPFAIKAMAELDIDITNQYSKTVNEFLGQEFSYAITVCDSAKELCPVFPGKHKVLHWSIEDPASISGTEEEMMKVFRKVRKNILEKVKHFVTTFKAG